VSTAYVVLSHHVPDEVARVVGTILASSSGSSVRVEYDGRQAPSPGAEDDWVTGRNHGLAADVGSWELAETGPEGLRRTRDMTDAEVVLLVSGQEYPVRQLADWERQVCTGEVAELIPAAPPRLRPDWGSRPGEGQDDLTRRVEPLLSRLVLERDRRSPVAVRRRPDPLPALRRAGRGRTGWHWPASAGCRWASTPFRMPTGAAG
jgi:hypothetical protein